MTGRERPAWVTVSVFVVAVAISVIGTLGLRRWLRARGGDGAPVVVGAYADRTVHLVAPHVVMIVARGGDPLAVQAGPWTAKRANGQALSVVKVHRHSYPVGQPGYEIGYGKDDDLRQVVVEHRYFVVLGAPVGAKERLALTSGAKTWTFDHDHRRTETPVLQLNQVGYHPKARARWAYVSMWMGDGGGLPLDWLPEAAEVLWSDGASGGSVPVRLRAPQDDAAGAAVAEIDLGALAPREGVTLRLHLPGVGVSYPSRLDAEGVGHAYRTVMRGLFHNRWGGDLRKELTPWPRPPDHPFVYTSDREDAFELFKTEPPKTGKRPLVGGYHDAGDFDQRPSHTVVPQLLLRAFSLQPAAFRDGELELPESGNGVPDLLDEVTWGAKGWLALQEPDGGVRGGVESTRHPWGVYFAHEDPLPYWTFARNANVSARAAGVMAGLARHVRPWDATLAKELGPRAARAFTWAKAHGASPVNLLYGASELWRFTGDARYREDFERLWRSIGPEGAFNRYASEQLELGDYADAGRAMPDFLLGYLTAPDADVEIRRLSMAWMEREADELVERVLRSPHGHRSARRTDSFAWGQGVILSRYMDPLVARLLLGPVDAERAQAYLDALSVAADFMLGANPAGRVYVTGLGTVSPEEPLHLDSLVWRKRGRPPVPGLPVYGPVSALPEAPWYQPAKSVFHPRFEEHPPLLRYADVRSFVVNSEFTVWETQAPVASHLAVLKVLLDGAPSVRTNPEAPPSPPNP